MADQPSYREERKGSGEEMQTAAPPATEEKVQFSGRIPASLRRRVRVFAAANDMDVQDVLARALDEYLSKRNH